MNVWSLPTSTGRPSTAFVKGTNKLRIHITFSCRASLFAETDSFKLYRERQGKKEEEIQIGHGRLIYTGTHTVGASCINARLSATTQLCVDMEVSMSSGLLASHARPWEFFFFFWKRISWKISPGKERERHVKGRKIQDKVGSII